MSEITTWLNSHKAAVLAVAGALGTAANALPSPYNAAALALAGLLAAAVGGSAATATAVSKPK
jgi:hypothetical protein